MNKQVRQLENFFKTGYPFPAWLDDGTTIMVRNKTQAREIMESGKLKAHLPVSGRELTKIVYNK